MCVCVCVSDNFSQILVFRIETCLDGLVDKSAGFRNGVASKLGKHTFEIAKRCAPLRF